MIRLILLILALSLSATAADVSPAVDISGLQLQYEQRLIERIQLKLDPVLGKENYTLGVKMQILQPQADSSREMFFSKLGMMAQLPESEAISTFSFSKWIKSLDVQISYAETLKDVDENKLKNEIGSALKSFDKIKLNITIDQFKPADPKLSFWQSFKWTPFTIFIGAILIASALLTALRQLSHSLEKSTLATGSAAASMPGYSELPGLGSNTTTSTAIERLPHTQDGLRKWREWLRGYPESALQFIERLTRSEQKGEEYVLAYLVQNTDLKEISPTLKALKKELHARLKEAAAIQIEKTHVPEIENYLIQNITQSFVETQTGSDSIIKLIHDFTIDECIEATNYEPALLHVFMNHFSTPHIELIITGISEKALIAHTESTGSPSQTTTTEMVSRARTLILNNRSTKDSKETTSITKWLTVASHLDSDREKMIYLSTCRSIGLSDSTITFVQENFPQFLVNQLPDSILKPVFSSIPYKERAELISLQSETIQKRILDFYKDETRTLDLLEFELKQISDNTGRKSSLALKSRDLHKTLATRLRKYIFNSQEHRATATATFKTWYNAEVQGDKAKKAA